MTQHAGKPHRSWILLVLALAAVGIWYFIGEFTWRRPNTVSNSADALVQPTQEMQSRQVDPTS